MSHLRDVGNVAWWEFRRCWRVKDLVVTMVLSVIVALVWFGVQKVIAASSDEQPARVVVLDANDPPLALTFGDGIEMVAAEGRDAAALAAAVEDGSLDAVVRVESVAGGTVDVAASAAWIDALRRGLEEAARAARLADAGLGPEAFARLTAPFDLTVRESAPRGSVSSTAEKIAAGLFIGVMLMALFVGNSYLFIYITGEKQTRVTEQIVSIISPQTWIDGKIAGLSVVALASMASMVAAMIVWNVTLMLLGGGYDLTFGVVRPALIVQLAVLAALGFLLWFAFFAAVAATIDDPNTSSRSILVFVPLVPLSVALACFHDADSLLVRVSAIFPLTSPSVLPARMVLTQVAWWEAPLAIVLLAATIWLTRRAAGKIFAMGILMHGQEPRWRDMLRTLWSA